MAKQRGASPETLARLQERYKLTDDQIKYDARVSAAGHSMPYVASIGQGVTGGYSDEIMAGIRSVAEGRPYADILGEERAALERSQQAPVSTVAEIAGAVALPGSFGRSVVAQAPTWGNRIAQGIGTGLGYGALYGSGTAEEGGRLQGAIQGGLEGAAAGGLMGAAMHPIAGAFNRVRATRGFNVESALGRALRRDEDTPRSWATRMRVAQERAAPGVQVMAADVAGPEVQAYATRGLMQFPGKGRSQMRSEIAGSQRVAGRQISRALDDLLGTTNVHSVDDLARVAGERAARDRKAYAPVVAMKLEQFPEGARQILRESFDQARDTPRGRDAMRSAMDQIKQRYGFSADMPDEEVMARVPFMETAHTWQSAMFEEMFVNKLAGRTKISGPMNETREGFLKSVDRALNMARRDNPSVPDYRAIRAATRDDRQYEEALKAGYAATTKPAADIRKAVDGLKGPERQAYRIGFASKLRDDLGKQPTANRKLSLLTSEDGKRRIAALGLDRKDVRRYLGQLMQFDRRKQLALASGNSQTAMNLQTAEDMAAGTGAAQTALEEAARDVVQGRLPGLGALQGFAMRNLPQLQEKIQPRRGEAYARFLGAKDPSILMEIPQMTTRRDLPVRLRGLAPYTGAAAAEQNREW